MENFSQRCCPLFSQLTRLHPGVTKALADTITLIHSLALPSMIECE